MRLMCPNCEAQYEVSDSVIPLHGRDVQCSNCGQTWFQTHPQSEPEPVEDEDDAELTGDTLPAVTSGAWASDDAIENATQAGSGAEQDTSSAEPATAQPAATAAGAPSLDGDQPSVGPITPDSGAEPGDGVEIAEPAAFAPPAFAPAAFAPADVAAPEPDAAEARQDLGDDGADYDADHEASGADAPTPAPTPAPPPAAGADSAAAPVEAVAPEPRRRSLDEAVLSVLREEAEREARARRASGGLETQTDLNLAAGEPAPRATPGLDSLPKLRVQAQAESQVVDLTTGGNRRPVEDLSAPVGPDAAEIAASDLEPSALHRASRRDLLPDIEEFSSSLRSDGGRDAALSRPETEARAPRRGGFRTGFLLVILLGVLVFVLYAAAPALGSRFPAAVPTLNQFVATVDKGRVMVDQLMQSSLDWLNGAEKPVE